MKIGEISFRNYTKYMMVLYLILSVVAYTLIGIEEGRSLIVSFFSVILLVFNFIQFLKYKDTYIYKNSMKTVIKKEPSMVYLGLAGIALALLSDSKEPLVLAIFLSCAMLNLKYVIMHIQLKNNLKAKY